MTTIAELGSFLSREQAASREQAVATPALPPGGNVRWHIVWLMWRCR